MFSFFGYDHSDNSIWFSCYLVKDFLYSYVARPVPVAWYVFDVIAVCVFVNVHLLWD